MDIFIKKNEWLPRIEGHGDFGWGNGYVVIPRTHSLYGKHYDTIHDLIPSLLVNGGLTFSRYAHQIDWEELPKNSRDGWVVGFDTTHAWDTLEKWPREKVLVETEILKKQLEAYKWHHLIFYYINNIWTKIKSIL